MLEFISMSPTWFGASDASIAGMSGVFCGPDVHPYV